MKLKVAVIAGTPVDTTMGIEYLNMIDPEIETFAYPATQSPYDTTLFQISSDENKRRFYTEVFTEAENMGIRDFFVYCNSLSGVFDFERFAAERGDRVYTPLQVYRELGTQYSRCAVIAANNQSTAGIEKALYANNPDIKVEGVGYLDIVAAVEAKIEPEELISRFGLDILVKHFEQNNMECLILGCTHFPWFKDALAVKTTMQVIDPAYVMYKNLVKNTAK